MTDQATIGITNNTPASGATECLVASRTWEIHTGSTPKLIVARGETIALSEVEYKLLSIAKVSLERHDLVNRITHSLDMSMSEAHHLVRSAERRGLLSNVTALIGDIRSCSDSNGTPEHVDTIGILTCDRPAQLRRCVQSVLRNIRQYHHDVEFVIIDDSTSDQARLSNSEVLREVDSELRIRRITLVERQAFVAELVKKGVDSSVAEYALLPLFPGSSPGAVRNALLLDTVGKLLLSIDDDILLNTCVHPELENGLILTGHVDPLDRWLFASRTELLEWATWSSCDIVGDHERLLGAGVSSCIKRWQNQTTPVDLCSHLAASEELSYCRIIATMPGKIGDCGRATGAWLLGLGGLIGEQVRTRSDKLRLALRSREVAELPRAAIVAHSTNCMTGLIGLDNRASLPPFPPHFAGEDGIFGLLLSRTMPNACWGVVPHGIVHDCPTARNYGIPFQSSFSLLVSALIANCRTIPDASFESQLCTIGRWLADIASLPVPDLKKFVVKALAFGYRAALKPLEERASLENSCIPFVEEVQSARARTVACLSEMDVLPLELKLCNNGWNVLRNELYLLGALLQHWNMIVTITADLAKQNNKRVSHQVRARRSST